MEVGGKMLLSLKDKKKSVSFLFLHFIICSFNDIFGLFQVSAFIIPATGRNEFIAIPTSEEVKMGQSVHQGLDQQYTISADSKYVERVNRIGIRIAMVSDRQDYQYNFFVVEGDAINAFTTPGGNVYLYTGLLEKNAIR